MIELFDHDDDSLDHVKWFLENSLDFSVKDEDAYMKPFLLHLQEKIRLQTLDKDTITSLAVLIFQRLVSRTMQEMDDLNRRGEDLSQEIKPISPFFSS